jgi:subtilisin family serine protease
MTGTQKTFLGSFEFKRPGRGVAAIGLAVSSPSKDPGACSWTLDVLGLPHGFPLTGAGVKVAVLDTGLDLAHPDFAGRFSAGRNKRSFVPGGSVQDGNGHGTHCAGIVAGPTRSASGIRYGVAPGVELLIGKVLTDDGIGTTDGVLDGIAWAADQGARVISLSLGTARAAGARFSAVYERIAETLLKADPGTLIVAAAGNSSGRPFLTSAVENPAACPSILSVAAVDQRLRITDSSCSQCDPIGPVDLCAPGTGIYSAWTGGGFRTTGGTSSAASHVAGVAALYLEAHPTLTALELRRMLEQTSLPLGRPEVFGRGLIQGPAESAAITAIGVAR